MDLSASWPSPLGKSFRALSVLVLFLSGIFGCGQERTPTFSVDGVRDTVVNGRREVYLGVIWSDGWPRWEVASVDTLHSPSSEEPAFGRISYVAMSDSGHLAVADGMTQEAWVRKESEESWTSFTHRGNGPAEIAFAGGLWWDGDTLVVFDAQRNRMIQFGLDGGPLGSGVLFGSPDQGEYRTAFKASSSDVFLVLSRHPEMQEGPGVQRPARILVRVSIEGASVSGWDTLGTWPGRQWYLTERSMAVLPFGADTHLQPGPNRVVVSDGALPEAWSLLPGDSVWTRVLWTQQSIPVNKARAAFVRKSLERVPPEARAQARTLFSELPFPTSLPKIGAVLALDGGFLVARWFGSEVERPEMKWPQTEWRSIRLQDPIQVASLRFPAGLMPVRVLVDSTVLVVLRDEMGREGVGVATLRRVHDG